MSSLQAPDPPRFGRLRRLRHDVLASSHGEGLGEDGGYIDGTQDPTGLTHLGAREYDPTLGRFISVDPIMDLTDPTQWHGYTYANNNPVTLSDPSGLLAQIKPFIDYGCSCTMKPNSPSRQGGARCV